MSLDPKLHKQLQAKLGVGSRRTNQLIAVEATRLLVSRELAAVSLASDLGIPLSKFADDTQLAAVRAARASAAPSGGGSSSTVETTTGGRRKATPAKTTKSDKRVIVEVTGAEYDDIPALMVPLVEDAKRVAEGAYPLLHLFENSMRELIRRVLGNSFGTDWWLRVPRHIQDKATEYQAAEAKAKWHTPRGREPIQYVDLLHLADIIEHKKLWPLFEPLFPRKGWVSALLLDLNVSRRIVAHMNVLPKAEVRAVQSSFRKWARQLKAGEHLIP